MSKLVLQLLIAQPGDKIFRNTGVRIFDFKSFDAAVRSVRAKSFGLVSKGKFVVQFPDPFILDPGTVNSLNTWRTYERMWAMSNGTGILPLFVRLGEVPVSSGPITEHRKGVQYFVHGEISRLFSESH